MQTFAKETYIWAKLDHPNIVRLEGVLVTDDFPSLVSGWAVHGTVTEYVKKYPDRNIIDLVCIYCPLDSRTSNVFLSGKVRGIAAGLYYLHEQQHVIHSDLKGVSS